MLAVEPVQQDIPAIQLENALLFALLTVLERIAEVMGVQEVAEVVQQGIIVQQMEHA